MSDTYQHFFIEALPEVDHIAPMGKSLSHSVAAISLFLYIVFYIPTCDEKDMLKSLIEKHGGLTTEIHECFTYQLHPLKVSEFLTLTYLFFSCYRD